MSRRRGARSVPGARVEDEAGAYREDDAEGLDAFRVRIPVDETGSGGANAGSVGVAARARRKSRRDAGAPRMQREMCVCGVGRSDVPLRERSGSEHPAVRHRPGDVVVVVLRGCMMAASRPSRHDRRMSATHVDTRAVLGEQRPGQRPIADEDRARGTFRARVDAAIARASRTDGVHPEAALGIGIAPRGANLIGAVNLLASGPRDAEGGHVARAKTNMVVAATPRASPRAPEGSRETPRSHANASPRPARAP